MTSATVSRAEMARAAAFVARAIPARPTPAEAVITIRPSTGGLGLVASGLDTHAIASVDADGEMPALAVPGGLLASWLAGARGDRVVITPSDGGTVKLASSGAQITLPCLATTAQEWPTGRESSVRMSRRELHDLLRRIAGASDPQFAETQAIRLSTEGGHLVASATNRYVMAQASIPLSQSEGEPFDIAPPARLIVDTVASLDDDEVELVPSGGLLRITGRSMSAAIRLVTSNGHWTAVAHGMAKLPKGGAVVDANALRSEVQALARLAQAARAKDRLVVLHGGPGATVSLHKQVGLEATSGQIDWDGDPCDIPINADYLLTGLAVVGTERVHIAQTGGPVFLSSPDSTGVAIVMPMRD